MQLKNKLETIMNNILPMIKNFFTKYVQEFVYGGIDGIITTFAIVASVVGANLGTGVALLLGFANVLADGFSMASSNYLSERADNKDSFESFKSAIVTFISFVILGSMPLIALIGYTMGILTSDQAVIYSLITASLTFAFVGYVKAYINEKNKILSVLETLAIGLIAAAIAYGVGQFAKGLI